MWAAHSTLPKPMKVELKRFFDENEQWLVAVLEEGQAKRTLRFGGAALEMARLLVSSLEGAMMLARSYEDVKRFEATTERLLATLAIAR